jgi:hypothetical protein
MGSETYACVQLVVESLEQLRTSLQFPEVVPVVHTVHPGWQSGCCVAFS